MKAIFVYNLNAFYWMVSAVFLLSPSARRERDGFSSFPTLPQCKEREGWLRSQHR